MIDILYVVTKGRWGGAQKYVYDLATNLPWRKFKVSVAIGSGEELPRRLKLAGLETINIPPLGRDPNWRNDWQSLRQLKRLLKERQPQIIHLNSSKVGLLGAIAGRWHNFSQQNKKIRIIFTAHGWAFKEDRPLIQRLGIKFLSWLTVVLAHQTITVSQDDLLSTKRWLFVKNKLRAIHNGIAPPKLLPRTEARKKLGLKPEVFVAGIVAELHQNKGLNYLLEALALSRLNLDHNFEFIIIGEGEERLKLEKEIERLGLTKSVSLLGQIDNAATLLSALDLFILPSAKEGLPYVLLEAGAAGLPVLTTDVGGIPEIVENMVSGILVKAKQPAELARALEFLVQNPRQRREFGARLRRQIRQKFSTEQMVKATLVVYNDE